MGGPGRKGQGGSKGGKGCKVAVPASLWKTYNPDPNLIEQSQWGHWRPAAPGRPLQMASESTQCPHALGAMVSAPLFSQVRLQQQKTSATPVQCKNMFEVLQDESASW